MYEICWQKINHLFFCENVPEVKYHTFKRCELMNGTTLYLSDSSFCIGCWIQEDTSGMDACPEMFYSNFDLGPLRKWPYACVSFLGTLTLYSWMILLHASNKKNTHAKICKWEQNSWTNEHCNKQAVHLAFSILHFMLMHFPRKRTDEMSIC